MQLVEFFRSRRGGELIGIVVVAIGISLAAALLTYHPRDSSAFYTSTDTEIRNAIGYYGATLAWIFIGFFGFASLLFPGVLLAGGWNRLWGREIEYFHTKLIGFVILTTALPPLFDLAIGKVWLRGSLIASGGYLGQEINRAVSGNLNTTGAVIALVTALLVGLLLATRISLAAVFLALHQQFVALGRAISLQWARFTERRRKEKMKDALVRKHLEKADAPAPLRLVTAPAADDDDEPLRSPIVREVKGAGKFQIRKVTKADLRKAAEALAQQEETNPFELYVAPPPPPPRPVVEEEEPPVEDFEDLVAPAPAPLKPKAIPRPAARRPEKPSRREIKLTHYALPPMRLLAEGPKQDV
ncbi:MAG TPA: DNA translocase FtsK 4TM domain-containing protein, partial [Thermoanaerobaculia bacterium]|nr:DNA translocase FtsK 4TM domain-containing protein [Thermoanaerobaculia bacterium]